MLVAGLLVVLISGGIDISFTAVASVAQFVALTVANAYGAGWFERDPHRGSPSGAARADQRRAGELASASPASSSRSRRRTSSTACCSPSPRGKTSSPCRTGSPRHQLAVHTDADGTTTRQPADRSAWWRLSCSTWFLLNRTTSAGRSSRSAAIPEAAQRLGFHVFRLNLLSTLHGPRGRARLAGPGATSPVGVADRPGRKELDVVAAVVLGGASLAGGVGTVLGHVPGPGTAGRPAERPRPDRRVILLVAVLRRHRDPRGVSPPPGRRTGACALAPPHERRRA